MCKKKDVCYNILLLLYYIIIQEIFFIPFALVLSEITIIESRACATTMIRLTFGRYVRETNLKLMRNE